MTDWHFVAIGAAILLLWALVAGVHDADQRISEHVDATARRDLPRIGHTCRARGHYFRADNTGLWVCMRDDCDETVTRQQRADRAARP